MALPNFLIIGAPRSGTTSLHSYLKQHPQIFLPEFKEPTFFAYNPQDQKVVQWYNRLEKAYRGLIRSMDDYEKLFTDTGDALVAGESSTGYLLYPDSCKNIKKAIPEVKLIASLRNPIDASYSLYNWAYMAKVIYTPLHKFSEDQQIKAIKDIDKIYFNPYFYFRNLKRYYDLFNPAQIKILIFEEWTKSPEPTLKKIFEFLGVDEKFQPEITICYQSNIIRSNKIAFFMKTLLRKTGEILTPVSPGLSGKLQRIAYSKFSKKPPPLSPNVRKKILKIYKDDIVKLEDLLQKDLSFWQ